MQTMDIDAARTELSRLVDAAAAGDEIIIARGGTPVARLVALGAPGAGRRELGRLAGLAAIPAESDAPLPSAVLDAFEGH